MKNKLPGLKNRFKTNRIIAIVKSTGSSNKLKTMSNIRLLNQNSLCLNKMLKFFIFVYYLLIYNK